MKASIIASVLAAGILVGCGGAAETGVEEDSSNLASREDRLRCITDSGVEYFSDNTYTTQVGYEVCSCGRTPQLTGRRTTHYRVLWEYACH